jgi:hypothetical protein
MPIEELESHKSPGTDQIPAELIKAGGRTVHCESISLLFLFGIRRNCLRSGRSRSLYLPIRAINRLVITGAYHF